jgi:branched-chain amino acid transport system substrate-binding protein
MKKFVMFLLFLGLLTALAACGGAPPPAPTAPPPPKEEPTQTEPAVAETPAAAPTEEEKVEVEPTPTKAAKETEAEVTTTLTGTVKVGAAHALSGSAAVYGESIQKAINLAAKQINEEKFLGEATLEVVWEDTAGDKEQSINVFNKLINEDQVVAILGPTLSNSAFAADPVAQEAGVPVIASSNTATGITEIGNYIFRTSLPESAVIPNTVKVAKEKLGLTKVAVMYGNDDAFTQSGYEVFAKALEAEGIEVVATETFAKGDTDFSAQLTKIQALEPEAIVVSALAEEAASIMIQARQLGIPAEVPFIGGNGFNSPKLFELGGEAANGAISGSAWNISSSDPASQEFVAAYEAEYGAKPDQFAAQAYTAAWALATAIRDADSADRAAIRDALDGMAVIDSPLGPFTFDDNRDPDHPPVVQVMNNGLFVLFE